MIRPKLWYSYLLFLVILLSFAPNIFAKDPWVLLHRGKGNDSNVYYNKETIKKIDNNIIEVFIQVMFPGNKYTVQQVRIDCRNNKTANGVSDIYIRNVKTQQLDFSKAGWIWFEPKNNVDKKLIKLVCKKK
jgi:hypothetical protein